MKTKSPKMTVSKLAAALGVSRQLVAAHRKKPDAPALDDVAGWTTFFAAHGRMGSSNIPPELRRAIAQKRLEILEETRAKLARENAMAAKELMPVADAIRHANTAGSYFAAELDRWARELPPAFAGLDCVRIAQIFDAQIERTRRELKAKLAAMPE